jgi:hypothetical protein
MPIERVGWWKILERTYFADLKEIENAIEP